MEPLSKEISEAFAVADFPKTILLLGKYFGTSMYSLTSLFTDERRKVLNMIMEPTLREAEAAYSSHLRAPCSLDSLSERGRRATAQGPSFGSGVMLECQASWVASRRGA